MRDDYKNICEKICVFVFDAFAAASYWLGLFQVIAIREYSWNFSLQQADTKLVSYVGSDRNPQFLLLH